MGCGLQKNVKKGVIIEKTDNGQRKTAAVLSSNLHNSSTQEGLFLMNFCQFSIYKRIHYEFYLFSKYFFLP
jgi:hypothetical protein